MFGTNIPAAVHAVAAISADLRAGTRWRWCEMHISKATLGDSVRFRRFRRSAARVPNTAARCRQARDVMSTLSSVLTPPRDLGWETLKAK